MTPPGAATLLLLMSKFLFFQASDLPTCPYVLGLLNPQTAKMSCIFVHTLTFNSSNQKLLIVVLKQKL